MEMECGAEGRNEGIHDKAEGERGEERVHRKEWRGKKSWQSTEYKALFLANSEGK